MMEMELVSEMLDLINPLTWLSTTETFIVNPHILKNIRTNLLNLQAYHFSKTFSESPYSAPVVSNPAIMLWNVALGSITLSRNFLWKFLVMSAMMCTLNKYYTLLFAQ